MTVYVYIWLGALHNPQQWTGHASLQFNSGLDWDPTYYISYWPRSAEDARKKSTFGDRPNRWHSLSSDISDLGSPDHTIPIDSLAEMAIKDYYYRIDKLPFNLFNSNCSTVVAHALQVGSGQWTTGKFWYPTQVLRLARRLGAGETPRPGWRRRPV